MRTANAEGHEGSKGSIGKVLMGRTFGYLQIGLAPWHSPSTSSTCPEISKKKARRSADSDMDADNTSTDAYANVARAIPPPDPSSDMDTNNISTHSCADDSCADHR